MLGDKPHEIIMPQLGLSMDSGLIVRWLKQSGDPVKQGEILLEVESDKSVVEVEAVASGRLHILCGPEDGPIKVGGLIGYLLAEGESVPTAIPGPKKIQEGTAVVGPHPGQSTQPEPRGGGDGRRAPSSPAARRRAAELAVDWRLAKPSGLRGQIREQDVIALADRLKAGGSGRETQPPSPVEITITPVARRLAEAAGLDLAALARTHPGKRLDREDVERALRQTVDDSHGGSSNLPQRGPVQIPSEATRAAWPLDELQTNLPARHEPISQVRRVVAERMTASVHIGAAVTLTTKADATELVRLREDLKAGGLVQSVPSYNVLLAALSARALVDHPLLNATLNGEEIIFWKIVNMGIAVDTERGLVVPVLRDVGSKSIAQLAAEAEDLLGRAAKGGARLDELTGGTFTITNLGPQEIDFFTPLINPPQCAVLGIGRMNKELVVREEDEPVIRKMLPLSLTFDHRLVDGAPAARFLKQVKQFVEQPYLWLR